MSHLPGRYVLAFQLLLVAVIAIACGSGQQSAYPVVLADDLVAAGETVYAANCAVCHGDDQTRPPLAAAPPHDELGHTWHHADRLLVEWVLDGVPLATVMPRFRGKLTEDEVRAAVAYIKTFWSDAMIELQTAGSAEYEAQLAGMPVAP